RRGRQRDSPRNPPPAARRAAGAGAPPNGPGGACARPAAKSRRPRPGSITTRHPGLRWAMRPRVILVLLALSLAACATPPMADDGTLPRHALIGTSWLAQPIDGTAADPAVQSTVTFQREDQVIGSGGCNRYFGRLG